MKVSAEASVIQSGLLTAYLLLGRHCTLDSLLQASVVPLVGEGNTAKPAEI